MFASQMVPLAYRTKASKWVAFAMYIIIYISKFANFLGGMRLNDGQNKFVQVFMGYFCNGIYVTGLFVKLPERRSDLLLSL